MGLLDLFKKKSAKSKDLSETIPEKEKSIISLIHTTLMLPLKEHSLKRK